MNIINNIAEYFKKTPNEGSGSAPEGICANCWGTQEYDGMIRKLYKDHQIDVNNEKDHYAFIQKFVIERIEGIHLKKGESAGECPTCVPKSELENS